MSDTQAFNARKRIVEKKAPAQEMYEEKHYRPVELAKLWGLSSTQIRTMFRKEPGVKYLGQLGSSEKRSYRTMLIPASVAQRKYQSIPNLPVAS